MAEDNDGPLLGVCTAPSEEQSSNAAYHALLVTDHSDIFEHQ